MTDTARQIDPITPYLEMLAALEAPSRGYAQFVLEYGKFCIASAKPRHIRQGPPKVCFGNSQGLLFRGIRKGQTDYTYMEGFACSGSLGFNFPVHHAWLVDAEGRVVDNTWDDPATSTYFGVAFRSDYVRSQANAFGTGISMIDNHHNRWEILRDPEVARMAVGETCQAEEMDFKLLNT